MQERTFETAASTKNKHSPHKSLKMLTKISSYDRLIDVRRSRCSSVFVCASVCVCVLCVTHAGARAAWQARPPFGWLASRREHGRGRKWSLAAGSRKD